MGPDFHGLIFGSNFTCMAFLPVSAASLIESCSFWYGLKDPFPMHKLCIDSVVIDQKGTCMEIPT